MSSPTVRTRVWRNGVLEKEDFPFWQVSDYLAEDDCLVWADICAPDSHSLDEIAEELSLDAHAVEDAINLHERPKAMRYTTHLFLSTYALRHIENGEVAVTHVSAFCMRNGLVTVRLDDGFDMDPVLQRWADNADLIKFGTRALIHGLLDVIVDGYFEAIGSLDDAIEELEGALFEETSSSTRDVQLRAFASRKALVRARRVILPMREVINTAMRRATVEGSGSELVPYYEDLYDHVLRAAEWTESLRDMMSSILETNMALSDTRLNLVMKKLTSWAAIIAVPTAITGYFGQNVPYPGYNTHWGFLLSVVLMLVISAGLYVMFKRKEWL